MPTFPSKPPHTWLESTDVAAHRVDGPSTGGKIEYTTGGALVVNY